MAQTPDRRVPIRTCVGCRATAPASELTRCRLTADGRARCDRAADQVAGRGAWICARSLACFDSAVRRSAFTRAWRRPTTAEELAELRVAFGSPDVHMRQSQVAGPAGALVQRKG